MSLSAITSTSDVSTPVQSESGPVTFTEPDGQVVISSSGNLIIGNNTFTVPLTLTAPTTVTTFGETFTFSPTTSARPDQPTTFTEPDGQVVISSSGVLLVGTHTLTIPSSLTAPTTITTLGETFTFGPPTTRLTTPTTLAGGGATFTEPDGQTVISSSGILIIGSDTITLPTGLLSATTISTDGETFTISPADPSSTSQGPDSSPDSSTKSASQSGPNGITFTEPDGHTVISQSGVIIIGSDTFHVPPVTGTQPITLTTDGETFTFLPSGSGSSRSSQQTSSAQSGVTTFTEPDGQTVISSSGLLIIGGSRTITVPNSLSQPTTLTTDGETFTFVPTASTSQPFTIPSGGITVTEPDGQTVVSSSGVLIIGGSDTITVPAGLTAPTTLTTDGETFTFAPTGSNSQPSVTPGGGITITEPDGQTVISSSGVLIIGGSDTITIPTGLTAPTTLTTDGETFTFLPAPSTTTSGDDGGPTLIPCVIPPLPQCIPCLASKNGCFPAGTGPTDSPTPIPCLVPINPICAAAFCLVPVLGQVCYPPGIGPADEAGDSTSTRSSTTSGCSTQTVTDLFVSCLSTSGGGAQSCTTTRRETITGCSVTATATTTVAAACSLQPVDFSEDEGNDDVGNGFPGLSRLGVASTVTIGGKAEVTFSFTASGITVLNGLPSPTTEIWANPTSGSCAVTSSDTVTATQAVVTATENFSIPSLVPEMIVPIAFADGPGTWTLTIGGPSQASDITEYELLVNGVVRESATDASQTFSWTSSSADTGTTLDFTFKADLGILIYDMTLVGTQPCTIDTPPSTTTTAPPSEPTVTGGFWIGFLDWNVNNLDATYLIGDHDHSCERLGFPNIVPFQTFVEDDNGKSADYQILTSGNAFRISQNFQVVFADVDGNMCGIKGLEVRFSPNGDELSFDDQRSPDTQGICTRVTQDPATCTDTSTGVIVTAQPFWHCAANSDPAFCNDLM